MLRSILLVAAFLMAYAAPFLYAQMPNPALVGYWHNWNDGNAPYRWIDSVESRYNVITVAFAIPTSNTDMRMTFVPDRGTNQDFITRIQRVQATGKKVLLSVGGATATIDLTTTANRDAFVTTMSNLLKTYGFDGMDIDIESGASILVNGGTIANPLAVAQINLIAAIKSIMVQYRTDFGRKMLLTFAPETAYIQGGQSGYGNIWGGYLPIVDALRDSLDLIHVQLYNSGTMYGIDKNIYTQGTADFIVAMTEAVIKGFTTQGGNFAGIAASKVAVGLPASVNAAGGGYVDSVTISSAVKYLLGKGPKPGTYTLAQSGGYSDLRGMMTWSINWDATTLNRGRYDYADVYESLFASAPPPPVPDKVLLSAPTANEQLRLNEANLRWFASKPSVTAYHVELVRNGTVVYSDTALKDTSCIVKNLAPARQIWWRVRARNTVGWGEWSDLRIMRTVPFPDQVIQVAPATNEQLTSNAATFRWRKSQPDVTQYRLVITTPTGVAVIDTVVADTTYSATFQPARIYMWRVVARNISGWGEWSPMWTFMTVPYPDQVQLVSLADSALISVDSASLTWKKSAPFIDRYHLEVTSNGTTTLSDSLLKDTSAVVRSLAGRSTIRWRVRAHNLSGWGPWSTTRQFRYLPIPTKVRLVTPADSARLDSGVINLSWTTPETDVTSYRIEIYRDKELISSDSLLTIRQTTLGTLPFNTWHRWRAQAKNLSGWGEWSDWRAFMIRKDTTTSVVQEAESPTMVAYPNPVYDGVTITSENSTPDELHIMDIRGTVVRRVADIAGKPLVSLSTADLPAGTYFVRRGSEVCSFMKQ
ncbi:MAG: glycosyl hydrolase family 18 protein [Candidatus Kapaibacterium sp.]